MTKMTQENFLNLTNSGHSTLPSSVTLDDFAKVLAENEMMVIDCTLYGGVGEVHVMKAEYFEAVEMFAAVPANRQTKRSIMKSIAKSMPKLLKMAPSGEWMDNLVTDMILSEALRSLKQI